LEVTAELADELLPVRDYHWYGADGEPLMTLRSHAPAASGWEPDYMFCQPALEAALDRRARLFPTVAVERACEAVSLSADQHGAELTVRATAGAPAGGGPASARQRTIRARWVVGADGANSFVRQAMRIPRRDLGFQERWLVADVEPADIGALALPAACQWCDPRRPTTHIQSGTRHRRWEFMLLPGERAEDFAEPDRVWQLLEPWFGPGDGVLTRHAVYEFRSMLAERMRDGRVLLVGDAAHLTPPFLGQGLCAGLRDAANVAWKLDLALRGVARPQLLDTVEVERQPQNEWIITLAIELGRVLCQLDPELAAERDAALRGVEQPPAIAMAPLGDGVLRRGRDGSPGPLAGRLSIQGRVAGAHREGLLDDVTGGGFTLLSGCGDPREHLGDAQRSLLDSVGTRIVSLDSPADAGVRDLDGRLSGWLVGHDVHAVLVRPDFYVFGAAASPADLVGLVEGFRDRLSTPEPIWTGS
jgi:2-polyprenyl-6-methoxyphenol hydroxylase-like FAD-dependent oxidoreductase